MAAVVQVVSEVGGPVVLDLNHRGGGIMLGRGHNLAEVANRQASGDEPFVWGSGPEQPGQITSRTITVPLVLLASTADAAAALMRALRQATAGRFVLNLQREGSSVPAWLRCAGGSLAVDRSALTGRERPELVQATLTAATEPHALGARVDVGPVTVTQDPASGTPFVLDVDDVAGDSLTPLVLRSSDGSVLNHLDGTLVTVRRRGVPSALGGLWVQGEATSTALGATPPTVATFTSDATFSGGGGMRATYTGTASGPWTATATFTSLTGPEAVGQYRLLARVRRGGAAAGQVFTLIGTAGPRRLVRTVAAGGNDVRVLDLGLVQVPIGQPAYMAAPQSPTSASAPVVSLTVVRAAAGTGTFDLDWMALVPADEDCGMLEVARVVPSGVLAVDGWDMQPRIWTTDPYLGVAPAAVGATGFAWVGGAPRVGPGDNRLWIVAGLGAASSRTPATTMEWSASFWPRHAWLG